MADASPSPRLASAADDVALPPEVRLEIRGAGARAAAYEMANVDFLIGSVPGCDLRLPGVESPLVLCIIARQPHGVTLRKLAPTQPLLRNGRPVTSTALTHGDRVSVAGVELLVHIRSATSSPPQPDRQATASLQQTAARQQQLDARAAELDKRQRLLEEQTADLEKDRVVWYQRREEMAREIQQRAVALPASANAFPQLEQQVQELDAQASDLARQKQELAAARQEVVDIRTQLYERYRERRDRLAGLQEAVERAARKVQENKRRVEADGQQVETQRRDNDARHAELERQAQELHRTRLELDEQRRRLDTREQEQEQELIARFGDYQERADKLIADRQMLEASQAEHRADLARLDRLQANLEQREKQLDARAREIEQRFTQLQQDSRDLEESVAQLDQWQAKLAAEAEQVKQQKTEQDAAAAQVAQRAAALEGQQAAVATLRTRLERMRLDIRKEEQQLSEQRAHQDEREAAQQQHQQELDRRRQELDAEDANRASQRQELLDRSATLDAAVAQLRQAQEALAAEENNFRERAAELDARITAQAEQASLAEGRAAQLEEAHKRVEAERQALRERTQDLAQAEEARQVLQEQLRRRSEELVAGQKALAEQTRLLEERATALGSQRGEMERTRVELEKQIAAQREELDRWGGEIEKQRADLAARELTWANHAERVKAAGRALAAERKALADDRSASAAQKLEAIQAASQARAEYEQARRAAIELQQQLPELELRAGTALERLTHAREQLRDHLAEVTTYTRQCQEDLEYLRTQVHAAGERVQQQELALRRSQDEHRLAVVAFRQQLIDWQAQVAEIKRLLAQDETRLVRQQARVEEQAREVDVTTQRLARQSEELEEQHRLVAERRVEMDRHLADMREWYRGKLRELAGVDASMVKVGKPAPRAAEIDEDVADGSATSGERPLILSITGEVDPSDRQLGDLLRSLGLIESETLMALLIEARQQRRSLRQMLLTSGVVTLYQLALIEAGNLDALMLGPVRVVDRLRVTPHEAVYRVFDPRRGQDAVLRHLAEAELQDAIHPDEFRQRFSQAILAHPNLAATLEVLGINGRPAALQEWLTGLPSTEWGLLTSAPGVCFRLLCQAALGLQTAHDIGLMHGHLQPESLLLTAEGILKICGFGEPLWLLGPAVSTPEDVRADLDALGRIVHGWLNPSGRKHAPKVKGVPDSLRTLVDRLVGSDISKLYPSAAVLLEDLDRVGADVPPNAEAWDRLLRHVRENALPATALRRSA
jgi:chromosome segregation ATPase